MADEREGQEIEGGSPASRDKLQTAGRRENAAEPLNASDNNGGAERYPEGRSFGQDADGETPVSTNEGRLGRGVDPAEGKR